MANQVLRDKSGNKIGEIVEQSGKLVIRDKSGNRLGEYDPKNDVTRDKSGNRIGKGNLLAALLVKI